MYILFNLYRTTLLLKNSITNAYYTELYRLYDSNKGMIKKT